MNQKVVIKQLRKLLVHLSQQVKERGDPRLKSIGFERRLFKSHPSTLNGYLQECNEILNHLEDSELSHATKQWQLEQLVEQCQAIQKVIYTLPDAKKNIVTPQQELAGFERRLLQMVADLEHQVATATGFHEQQQLLSNLEITRQRLKRCQTAQKDYSWKRNIS